MTHFHVQTDVTSSAKRRQVLQRAPWVSPIRPSNAILVVNDQILVRTARLTLELVEFEPRVTQAIESSLLGCIG